MALFHQNTDWRGVSTCSLEAPPLMRPQMICSTLSGSLMWTVVFSNWGICRERDTERGYYRLIFQLSSNVDRLTALETLDQHDSKKDFSSDYNTPASRLSLVVLAWRGRRKSGVCSECRWKCVSSVMKTTRRTRVNNIFLRHWLQCVWTRCSRHTLSLLEGV